MLVSVCGDNRRAYGVVDGGSLRIIGPRTHLALDGATCAAARHRRHTLDEELLELSAQRGYVDAAGTTYLVGPFEDWDTALSAALGQSSRPAPRWRLWAAAAPRGLAAACAAAALALLVFQAIWAAGHDVTATMERVVGDKGLESCAVRWTDGNRSEYAEVDCYEPLPAVGSPVVVRALALRPAFDGPVTSEWEYHLVRMVTDEWTALLFLGERPHWLVELRGAGHPDPEGWCGVRRDLQDGGAVQLLVDGGFWMAAAPVARVDDELLQEIREDLVERLTDLGAPGEPGVPDPVDS